MIFTEWGQRLQQYCQERAQRKEANFGFDIPALEVRAKITARLREKFADNAPVMPGEARAPGLWNMAWDIPGGAAVGTGVGAGIGGVGYGMEGLARRKEIRKAREEAINKFFNNMASTKGVQGVGEWKPEFWSRYRTAVKSHVKANTLPKSDIITQFTKGNTQPLQEMLESGLYATKKQPPPVKKQPTPPKQPLSQAVKNTLKNDLSNFSDLIKKPDKVKFLKGPGGKFALRGGLYGAGIAALPAALSTLWQMLPNTVVKK